MIKNNIIYMVIGGIIKSLWDFLRSNVLKNPSKLSVTIIVSTIVIALIALCDIYDVSKKYSFLNTLDFHNINNYFSAVITGIITILAMWLIDNQNKKRWEKDSIQKYKNDLAVNVIYLLSKFKDIASNIMYNQEHSEQCQLSKNDFTTIQELNEKYTKYHWLSKDKYIIENWEDITCYFYYFEGLKKRLERVFEEQNNIEFLQSAKDISKEKYGEIQKNEGSFIFNIVKCGNNIPVGINNKELLTPRIEEDVLNFIKTMEIKSDKILLYLLEKYKLK